MKIHTTYLDVDPYLAKGEQPIWFLERPLLHGNQPNAGVFNTTEIARRGTFWVPGNPDQRPIEWSMVNQGQYVRVPIWAIRTSGPIASEIPQYGLVYGVRLMDSLREHTRDPVLELVLFMGENVHALSDGYRFYVGLAFKTKE